MSDWQYIIYIHPFYQQWTRDELTDGEFSSKCRDYLQEFRDKATRRPFIHPEDWENILYELDEIITYFDTHSDEYAILEEISYNLGKLGEWGNQVLQPEEQRQNGLNQKKLAWICIEFNYISYNNAMDEINAKNGYNSKILEEVKI